MARLGTLINTLLAVALLCALPTSLYARPRAHAVAPPRGRQHAARPVERHREAPHLRHAEIRAPKRHTAVGAANRHAEVRSLKRHPAKRTRLAKFTKVSITPHASLRSGWVAASRNPAQPVFATPSRTKEVTPSEAAELETAPAPDLTGATDASVSIPVPVISVIRKTGERPQLPSIEDAASTPAILPSLYDTRGHLVVPPALKGSHEILVHQNEMADRDGLSRVQDDEDLLTMRRSTTLVALPVNGTLRVDERLPSDRRYCRPWTAQFLATLALAHYARFHTALQVNSAVRTVAIQQRLLRTNGNAAPASGSTASPHLTGQAIDLAKRGMPLEEIAWMRGYLLPLVRQGKIDVEEEFQQSCFHISVYKAFDPMPNRMIAVTHRDRPAALAIALP